MAIHVVEEANRCLECKRAMCQIKGCPVHTPIPEVIGLFKERRMDEAGALLFENNPMSAVCSLICNHSNQCEGNCIQGRKGNPVHFSSIESYISRTYLDRYTPKRTEPNGKSVAVIGSGPAGITVAIKMAEAGCDVTVFEQKAEIGGVLRYGIPEFRLSKELVGRYRDIMVSLGVRLRPSTTIGGALNIDDLFRDGYDSVFVGTGTWRARKLDIRGQGRGNVFFGIDYLVDPDSVDLGRDVAIIGVGNVAMDVARTALRHGAHRVTLYSNTNNVTASSEEVEYAELEGCEIVRGKDVIAIEKEGPVFRTAIFDEDGNVTGYEDELDHVTCDTVVIAVSQLPKDKLVLTTDGLATNDRGLLEVDEKNMCTVPGVFAAGDVATGPRTVVHAVAGAKVAIEGMKEYMGIA
ncbi:pyridine nucleotide-disulfide oxidoreductase [Collinsella sp. An271]|uniref:FAD-dependent oxidoreductase n=1 Tax=Collinsella sp. An271 TaxID=1965616 RepID=UPI000B3934A8|nr:FAD-dependent oxidoreductase [Collinsella sp. An271]OUO58255.1 pyridine nucleotide-disulfide oxidoreductase [Collinsella sp. An271]